MASRSWDRPSADWDVSSDEDVEGPGWRDLGEATNPADASPEEAGDRLGAKLLRLLNTGGLSAKSVCTLSFYAKQAGAVGFVRVLAHNPNAKSGHFQRHLDGVLSFDDERKQLYELKCPGHDKYDMERVTHTIHVLPFHEQLADEVAATPGLDKRCAELTRAQEWSDDYYDHPVVVANPGQIVYPLALYLDGVAHTKVDSVLGVTLTNLVTGTRHLGITLRKSLFCRCGCRGWCTLDPMFRYIHWCIKALAKGRFPKKRHGQLAWAPTDEFRESLEGASMGFKAALLQIKGDWSEFARAMGFHDWKSRLRPCLFCDCSNEDMIRIIKDWTLIDDPCVLTTPDTYDAECATCEVEVELSREDHTLLKGLLNNKNPRNLKQSAVVA